MSKALRKCDVFLTSYITFFVEFLKQCIDFIFLRQRLSSLLLDPYKSDARKGANNSKGRGCLKACPNILALCLEAPEY